MAANASNESSSVRPWQIILLVALLAGAGFLFLRPRASEMEQPDSPETAQTYVCLECGHGFDLTPAKYEQLDKAGGVQVTSVGTLKNAVFVRCEKCQKPACLSGARCPKDGTPVPRADKTGRPGHCSKCNWALFGS